MTEARLLDQEKYELSPEMEIALNVKQKKKNTGIMRSFFMQEKIQSPSDIDCYVRDRFLEYLDTCEITAGTHEKLVRKFDDLVISKVPIFGTLDTFSPKQRFFQDDRMFLLYLPDQDKAKSFKKVVDKTDLIIDVSGIKYPKVKEQLKQILCGILNMDQPQRYRRTYLKPFQCFIDFVRKQDIKDILQLETADEMRFSLLMNSEKEWLRTHAGKLITFSRQTLFLTSEMTEWKANVWFLERFRLDKSRVNESCPVDRLSFLDVTNRANRAVLQEYLKYLIGVSDMAVSSCRNILSSLSKFLQFIDSYDISLEEIDEDIMLDYIEYLGETGVKILTGNRDIINLENFFQYARVKCHMDIKIRNIRGYLKRGFHQHNDRSVPIETVCAILKSAHEFQQPLGLMYLILFCTGIRKSEICLLKGRAFFEADGEHWMRVYQQKAHFDKVIPIPEELYVEATAYIRENKIMSDEYMFKNADGNAYNSLTFSQRMIKECRSRGITCGSYIFRAHDYRHTMATMLRDNGVSLQATREFMGHQSEEMTKQYIDNMQERIMAKQEQYLQTKGGIEDV